MLSKILASLAVILAASLPLGPTAKTHTYGCGGHGKDKCKIALFVDGEEICKSARNACSKSKIVMNDRSTVILRTGQRNQNFLCQFR